MKRLDQIWQRLREISQLEWSGTRHGETTARGTATVRVEYRPQRIIFDENGTTEATGIRCASHNRIAWDFDGEQLRLSHLRRGDADPVFLLSFADEGPAESAHHCPPDLYRAEITTRANGLALRWEITGPKKNDVLLQHYT